MAGKTVDFYALDGQGNDQRIGSIGHAGRGLIVSPPDHPVLVEVARQGARDPKTGRHLDPDEHADEWLDALHANYRGGYLRAGKPR